MIELKERIAKYLRLNDLEKIFQYLYMHPISYERMVDDSWFPSMEIHPEKGCTLEETQRKYKAFVAATVDNRYIPTELYIPEGRNLYIRTFPRYMQEHVHYHRDALEIDMVLQGGFSQTINGTQLNLKQGDVLFISPHIRHTARSYSDSSVVFTLIVYQRVLKNLLDSIDSGNSILRSYILKILYGKTCYPYLSCFMEFDGDLAGMLMDMEENQEGETVHVNKYMEAGLHLFLLRLLVKHESSLQVGSEVPKFDADVLNIMDYIETNYMHVTLDILAKSYNYSPNYLSSLIKTQYGKSFHEILEEVKMRNASKLLLETELSISRIAEMTGYSDKSYFLKRFKRYFGMTTSQFRENRA